MNSYIAAFLAALQIIIIGGPPKSQPAARAAYYVRTDGNNACNGTVNAAGSSGNCAWQTIDYATNSAQVNPGDTIRVQEGTYLEVVTPQESGTLGNPITYVADGTVTFLGIDSTSYSYVRWIGFTIDTDAGGTMQRSAISLAGTNTGLEFWNNTVRDALQHGISNSPAGATNNSLFIGNTVISMGHGDPDYAGSGMGMGIYGSNNLFAYDEMSGMSPDAFVFHGIGSRWLNIYTHGFLEQLGAHADVFQGGSSVVGVSFALVESLYQEGDGLGLTPDEHTINLSNGQFAGGGPETEILFRQNAFSFNGSGTLGFNQSFEGDITYTRAYHNTTVKSVRGHTDNQNGGPVWLHAGTYNSYLFNDLFYEAWGSAAADPINVFTYDSGAAAPTADYNLAYDEDGSRTFSSIWTVQAHEQSNVNPQLTNVAAGDFTLGVTSGAIGAAGPLTTTSGSGTGTTFNVVAGGGGFFRGPNTNLTQYGGNLTAGDVITVGTDVVTVVSIATDAITVTPSFTWADAEPVYYGNDTTPDIGAYPYKASGYTLTATYAISSGSATITPNDASLVRFVVCYNAGVPYAVDNSSPYTCPVQGTFSARVYPRYASRTLWVVATP